MVKLLKLSLAVFFMLTILAGNAQCQQMDIADVVNTFIKDTDIQKSVFENKCMNRMISVSGVIDNVQDENTFDVTNDIERKYYMVTTVPEKTKEGNSYRAMIIYKDFNKVKGLDKGQNIKYSGKIIKVVDEGLYISVWLTADNLTRDEERLFK